MATPLDRIAGITIDVEDLVAVRATLAGLARSRRRWRSQTHSGSREIRLRGRGMEYEESRAYVYGDDMRTMDWRVMARTGEAHTKLFAEEKDRCSLIAVDLSPSMFFGTRFAFKSWAAAQLAAHLGWLAVLGGERVGGLVVSSAHHAEIRPGKTRSGLLGIFHHLARADARRREQNKEGSQLNRLLGDLLRVARPDMDIALISDFLDADDETRNALATLTRTNRVYHYWIHDSCEIETWPRGDYALRDQQGSTWLELDDPGQKRALDERLDGHRRQVELLGANFNIPLIPVSCNHDIATQMLQSPQPRS